VVVPALALDRLGDEAGDIVRVGLEGRGRLGQRPRLGRLDLGQVRGDRPAASFRRLFQSNAVFSAFSTASAPPSTKNRCGSARSPSTRSKVSTNCA